VTLPPGVPAYEDNYDSGEVLDGARLARLQAAMP
jgi:hypothetical protein